MPPQRRAGRRAGVWVCCWLNSSKRTFWRAISASTVPPAVPSARGGARARGGAAGRSPSRGRSPAAVGVAGRRSDGAIVGQHARCASVTADRAGRGGVRHRHGCRDACGVAVALRPRRGASAAASGLGGLASGCGRRRCELALRLGGASARRRERASGRRRRECRDARGRRGAGRFAVLPAASGAGGLWLLLRALGAARPPRVEAAVMRAGASARAWVRLALRRVLGQTAALVSARRPAGSVQERKPLRQLRGLLNDSSGRCNGRRFSPRRP